ncbi:hypothetical protein ACWDBP_00605 [Streptomyces sp. NPDC001233]
MRKIARIGLLGGLAAVAAVGFFCMSSAGTAAPPELVAGEGPGYAVEDFNYPNADKILADQGIKLKRGDGHITLAACGSEEGLLEVWARKQDKICFRSTGQSGYLSLEIPAVFGIKGNSYQTTVDMTVGKDKEQKSFEVTKNAWTPVGETADPGGRDYMLVEISTKK